MNAHTHCRALLYKRGGGGWNPLLVAIFYHLVKPPNPDRRGHPAPWGDIWWWGEGTIQLEKYTAQIEQQCTALLEI